MGALAYIPELPDEKKLAENMDWDWFVEQGELATVSSSRSAQFRTL
ncbi:hypothetical protein ACVJBD_000531 [Rhizobium mongolense]